MSIGIIAVIVAIAAAGLFLIWRAVRLFMRLAIVGVVVLLIVGLFAWNNWSGSASKQGGNRPAKTGKSNSR